MDSGGGGMDDVDALLEKLRANGDSVDENADEIGAVVANDLCGDDIAGNTAGGSHLLSWVLLLSFSLFNVVALRIHRLQGNSAASSAACKLRSTCNGRKLVLLLNVRVLWPCEEWNPSAALPTLDRSCKSTLVGNSELPALLLRARLVTVQTLAVPNLVDACVGLLEELLWCDPPVSV